MTNLEWLARNADDLAQNCFCEFVYYAKHGRYCDFAECKTCTMGNVHELIKTLNEEHEENEDGR